MKKKTKKILIWLLVLGLIAGAVYLSLFTFQAFTCPNGKEVFGNWLGRLFSDRICNL